jgi:hypothetical protein
MVVHAITRRVAGVPSSGERKQIPAGVDLPHKSDGIKQIRHRHHEIVTAKSLPAIAIFDSIEL